MQISLKKYAHKYEYLKLELEETQEKVTNYTKLWNTEIGKFYLDQKITAWENIDTGEIKFTKPVDRNKKVKPEKLKKLYRTLSSVTHPDKGGSVEEFNLVKTDYESGDFIGLLKHADSKNIDVDLDENDIILFEETCNDIESEIEENKKSTVWKYFNGDLLQKKAILKGVEKEFSFTFEQKDYDKILNLGNEKN